MKRSVAVLIFCSCLLQSVFAQDYFPNLAFGDDQRLHNFTVSWYSKHLRTLKEPPLLENVSQNQNEIFRFTWLRTWDKPVSIRVTWLTNGTAEITTKVSDGAGGYDPGVLIADFNTQLDVRDAKKLKELLEKCKFWTVDSFDRNPKWVVNDGERWIYEYVTGPKYHVTTRTSPRKGAYRTVGEFLLNKVDLESRFKASTSH